MREFGVEIMASDHCRSQNMSVKPMQN